MVPQADGVADRSACSRCRGMDERLGLQDRHSPETDPCVKLYQSKKSIQRREMLCA